MKAAVTNIQEQGDEALALDDGSVNTEGAVRFKTY